LKQHSCTSYERRTTASIIAHTFSVCLVSVFRACACPSAVCHLFAYIELSEIKYCILLYDITSNRPNLISDDKHATIWVVLDASRHLQHLVAKEEVEIKRAVSVVVRLDAEQRHSTVASVGDDEGGVGLIGGRETSR